MPELTPTQRASGPRMPRDWQTPKPTRTLPVKPCAHWDGATYCGATPTREYLTGAKCAAHSPAALAGRPETTPAPWESLPTAPRKETRVYGHTRIDPAPHGADGRVVRGPRMS